MTPGQSSELTRYAKQSYRLSMEMADSARERAELTAITVGRHAKRMGLTVHDVTRWLQAAYGAVWVVGGALNPGMDLKEIRDIIANAMN